MTAEVKYYLDLDDVLAIRLECAKCHVSSSFPLAKLISALLECPHCKADWLDLDTTEAKSISQFLASLAGAVDALRGRPFHLSLEVNYEEAKEPT